MVAENLEWAIARTSWARVHAFVYLLIFSFPPVLSTFSMQMGDEVGKLNHKGAILYIYFRKLRFHCINPRGSGRNFGP